MANTWPGELPLQNLMLDRYEARNWTGWSARFEQHMDAPYYPLYVGEKLWTVMPAGYLVQQHARTLTEFPPRQAPANFNPQAMLESVMHAAAAGIGNT